MKKTISIIGIAVLSGLAMVSSLSAQTNQVPNLLGTNSATQIIGQISPSADVAKLGSDIYTELGQMIPFTTNGNATAKFAAGENSSSKKLVLALAVEVPVTANTAIGFVGAYAGGTPYEGGLNVTYGITNSWPVLGAVRSFAGDGGVYNFKTDEPANYSFAGFEKSWTSGNWDYGIGAVIANTSDQAGVDILGGFHVTYWWGKHQTVSGL